MNNPTLLKNLRNIPDFPIPGIQFKDVTTLFKSAKCMKIMVNELYDIYKDKGITKVVGIESRGFVVGAALAVKLGAGFVMCRKPGKLPAETLQESYMKEYGKDTIEIHKDAIDEKDVATIGGDDLLAPRAQQRNVSDHNLATHATCLGELAARERPVGTAQRPHDLLAPGVPGADAHPRTSRCLSERSRIGAECVSAPQETKSTPRST